MKILITGSSGFIGLSLRKFLEKRGIEVIPYDLKDTPPNDVRDFSNLKSKMKGVDGVVHLAAISRVKLGYEDPLTCIHTNIGGTINVLEACRLYKKEDGHPWMIFGSSREVFGEPKTLPVTEKTPHNSINIYGVAKVAGEDLCRNFSQNYRLKTRVLRFSNVYTGKNDQLNRVIPKFILQAFKNEDLVINGTGKEVFDFTYIGDTIQGIWGCIQEIEKSQVLYNNFTLSTGRPTTLKELAETIIREVGSKSKTKYAKARSYDVNKFYADPQKAKDILGFDPKTGLREGIRLVVEEFKREKMIIPEDFKHFKNLKVLSLGYTRDLLALPEKERGETSKRLGYYSRFLDKYFILVFSLKKHQLKKKEIGNMIVIPTNGFDRLDALFKMYKLGKEICEQNEIDIIQAQDPIFTGLVGYFLKRKYNKPLNVCVYGCDPYDKNWLGEKKLNLILALVSRYIIKNSNGIQVDGSGVLRSLVKKARIPSSKVAYKPMIPQDINLFKTTEGTTVRKELLKNEEEKILLFVGRLTKQKNIPFLLNSYKKILQEFPRVRLVIIGQGEEREKLKNIVRKLKVQDKITWIKEVPYSRIPEYFRAADIFVLSSFYEGFPRVLMEAAMAKKPIVSTNVSGTDDIIIDGRSGFIVPQKNKEEFVRKILFLLQTPEIAREMGRRGQEIMEIKFDPQLIGLKQVEIWDKIAQK
ncbi:MAG: glycosyltransferase [Candidatus Nealsonbacteria bacterium]